MRYAVSMRNSGARLNEAPRSDVDDAAAPAPGDDAASAALSSAWPAIALYAGLRAFGTLFLWVFAQDQGRGLLGVLSRYDAILYAGIVRNGYDQVIPLTPDGRLAPTNLAFFPLFPGLIALTNPILPGGARIAGIVISWLAGLAAAWALFAIGNHLHDRRTGILLAALWAVVPHAVVQSMGYTETLFTALAGWSLYALLRRKWVTAGLVCMAAGLTRPTAGAVIAALGLAALVAICRRRDSWRPWLGAALAPLGLIGYLAWVGIRLGRIDGYFHVQNDAWKMSYDTGGYTLHYWHIALTKAEPFAVYGTTFVLLAAFALLALLIADRPPWPLLVYAIVMLAMVFFGHGYYPIKGRLLMPAFPLLLPIAYALASARRSTITVVLATLAVASAAYGTYLCLAWPFSP